MTLYLNNRTAMIFWCMVKPSAEVAARPSSVTEVTNADTHLDLLDDNLNELFAKEKTVHLLLGDRNQRTSAPHITFHLRTQPYPNGAFYRYNNKVLVASPELCFLEMANEIPFIKLVEFGFLICGTYTVNPQVENPNKRQQLTTVRKVRSFIDRMGTARGCRTARDALQLVFENSASPRETKLAILLCAPTKYGGYGLPRPTMNWRIDFTEDERLLFGHSHVEIDLYWPQCNYGIEYDGEADHSESGDVSRDRRKDSELDYRGIKIIRVDKDQLANPHQVFVLAKKCARRLGKDFRKPSKRQWDAKCQLFETLMHKR